jgi:hypothetical protein
MFIDRTITPQLTEALRGEKKVVILYGPRQAGKTTLITSVAAATQPAQFFNGDDLYAQDLFKKNDLEALRRAVGGAELLIIDEAQRIENIGLSLKVLIDNLPLTILVSGSASFELANKVSEPLTGRTKTFWLYPFSWFEVADRYRRTSAAVAMDELLRFGMFPKVHTLAAEKEKEDYLYEYLNNYLYKDLLMFGEVRKPKKVVDLLTLLALQLGGEVSLAELAQQLSISHKAVGNYLDVLEKMFVVYNLRGFSRNLRKEISKTSKYYFMDVGLRNALLRNFNKLTLRSDAGALFENWFIMEKIKQAGNTRQPANFYFWRTYDQKEIDLIEERQGRLVGYEMKWSADKKAAAPADWLHAYQNASFETVHPQNCFGYLSDKA